MKTLKELFCGELAEMFNAEQSIARTLPAVIKAVSCADLREALESHLKDARSHIIKLGKVNEMLDENFMNNQCRPVTALLEEGVQMLTQFEGSPALNAALIAVVQKMDHYAIASYGCLREWAGLLDYGDAAVLLDEILDQEKAADESLTELARSGQNEEACSRELCEADVSFEAPPASMNFQSIADQSI